MTRKSITKTTKLALAAGISAVVLAGSVSAAELGISDADYSLEKLIEAAKKEGPITVVDATGKIADMAKAFTEKYGIEATGVKMSGQDQEQIILREFQAKNVQTDVFNMSNLPSVTTQIMVLGAGASWMPADLKEQVPAQYQSPAITSLNPWVWAYNTDVHKYGCPIDNIWALTTEDWNGRVAIPDPLLRNETMFWFNQIATHNDAEMRDAYKAFFGEELKTDEESATAEWVKRLAKNKPSVTRSDTDVGPIVGAAGQEKPFMGFLSTAIFRDAKKNEYGMGVCDGLKPWVGQLTPRVAVIATGTKHPNAAKLFVHFMMSGEGMIPQLGDGKLATNLTSVMPENEASNIVKYIDQMHVPNSDTASEDFEKLQDWQDFWLVNSR
jgi:iron(III) transport system substrate-binding protein